MLEIVSLGSIDRPEASWYDKTYWVQTDCGDCREVHFQAELPKRNDSNQSQE